MNNFIHLHRRQAEMNTAAAHEAADDVRDHIGHDTDRALQWAILNATLAVAESNMVLIEIATLDSQMMERAIKDMV